MSRLDHDANVRPWVQAAARAGAVVRWAEVDLATGELPAGQYEGLVTERTRLVAVSAASNVLGTRPDVAAITAAAHAAGALTYVDGVHAAAHGPVDAAALGADFYATSAYKWSGPHIGAVVADPALLETLRPDKLASSSDEVPERFEQGTSPFADFAGVVGRRRPPGLARPGRRRHPPPAGAGLHGRRRGLRAGAVRGPAERPGGDGARDHLRQGGPADRHRLLHRGRPRPRAVAEHLAARGVNVWNGHNYAWELTGALAIRDAGSAVRAGLVHYNDRDDVDRLLAGVAELG